MLLLFSIVACVLGVNATTTFSVDTTNIDGIIVRSLRNQNTLEQVNILENFGGKIDAIRLLGKGKGKGNLPPREVLASRCPDLSNCTGDLLRDNNSMGAMLIPYANRVYQGVYNFPQHTPNYLSPPDDNTTTSHGFLYAGRALTEVSSISNDNFAQLTLTVNFDGSDPGYPFIVQTNITYTLDASGFNLKVTGENLIEDGTSLPWMVGWHPYFKLLHSDFDTVRLELDTNTSWNRMLQRDDVQVPAGKNVRFDGFDGKQPLNDCLRNVDCCPLCGSHDSDAGCIWDDGFKAHHGKQGGGGREVRIHDGEEDTILLSLGGAFNFLQVYSGNECGLAVEPMSGATDNWNNLDGVVVLEAGEVWEGKWGVKMEAQSERASERAREGI